MIVLITKGETTTPSKDLFNCALASGIALYALIKVSVTGGPCFNPALGIAMTIYQRLMVENEDGHLTRYLWVYTLGPTVGAAIAGAFQIRHTSTIAKIQSGELTTQVTIL